jgi:cytidylate kinase
MKTQPFQTHEVPQIAAANERRMLNWVLQQEHEAQSAAPPHFGSTTAHGLSYVTISREVDPDSREIADLVGRRLGWPVYDKNLLEQVAKRYGESLRMLAMVDETPPNWLYDLLGSWIDRRIITHERFLAHVSRVILCLARRGSALFLGRGAAFLLPREKTLVVRLVAPMRYRLDRFMQSNHADLATAQRLIEEADRGRRDFVKRYFHHDIDDSRLYDMVLNVQRLGVSGAAELILAAAARGWELPSRN